MCTLQELDEEENPTRIWMVNKRKLIGIMIKDINFLKH